MANWATTTRVNAVVVHGADVTTDTGRYLDPSLQTGGANAGTVVPIPGTTTASAGQLFRGQPIAVSQQTGFLVPPNAASSTVVGILVDDVTQYVVASAIKVTYAKRGRVRTYAGAALTIGAAVKADTSASFGGVVPWVSGTDSAALLLGYVYPLDDGSAENGASAATAIAAGDTIFLDLRGI